MQEVAVGNYRAFIAAADALLAIREEVSSIDKHLDSLVIHNRTSSDFVIFNCFFDTLILYQMLHYASDD